MKRAFFLFFVLFLFAFAGVANATLLTIGTATYSGSDYKLIWDDDNNGNSVIWLDYTHATRSWTHQNDWASSLNGSGVLTYHIDPDYTVDWGTSSWRLPDTVDGERTYGYKGPVNGVYDYTYGYNLYNSEMGHLFYEELGNKGLVATDGTVPQPGWGLTNTGDFEHLGDHWYWSGTEYAADDQGNNAWHFYMHNGQQDEGTKDYSNSGIALRSGLVSAAPVPEPATVLLLGLGLAGIAIVSQQRTRSRC